jgi:hypothetical protein
MLDRVRDAAEHFDIVHFHIDQFHFPLFKSMADRTVTTLHGRQDIPDLKPLYLGFPIYADFDLTREPVPTANPYTVLHGISHRTPIFTGARLCCLPRADPPKRPDRAIRTTRLGFSKIAAKVTARRNGPRSRSSRSCSSRAWSLSRNQRARQQIPRRVVFCFRSTGRSRSAQMIEDRGTPVLAFRQVGLKRRDGTPSSTREEEAI